MVVNTMAKADKIYETDNSNPEIQAVKEAIKKTKDKRMYQRYMVILYHLKGYINIEISRMVDLCQHTVGTYVNKYKENGLKSEITESLSGIDLYIPYTKELTDQFINCELLDELGAKASKSYQEAIHKILKGVFDE